MSKELKPMGNNKYDILMKNQIVKAPKESGLLNAVNKTADIHYIAADIVKLAEERKPRSYENSHNYQRPEEVRYQRPRSPEDVVLPLAGGILLGSAGFNAYANKDIGAPVKVVSSGLNDFKNTMPKKFLKRTKGGKYISEVLRSVKNMSRKKVASDYIYEIEKTAAIKKVNLKKNFINDAKLMIRQDFVRPGIEAVPYFAAPAALSYLVGKDINNNLSPVRGKDVSNKIVIDVPLEKKASISNKFKKAKVSGYAARKPDVQRTWKEWSTQNLPSQALRGLGRSIFPASVIALVGRDIKRDMARVDMISNITPIPEGHARIVIETNDKSKGK